MIYLTHYKTAATDCVGLINDIVYPQKVHWFPETYAKAATGMVYPPHKVAEKVLDPAMLKMLREQEVGKTAFILAAGNTHFAGLQQKPYQTQFSYVYKFLPLTLTQVYAGRVALTVEDGVSNAVLEFFGDSKAVLTAEEEAKGVKPSAFDKQNRGFYVGQGAAFAVFDSWVTVNKTGDNPIAQLCGAYTAAEASTNAIGQLEDGSGFVKAIEGTFDLCKLKADDVKIVKTHGTGTISNNISELAALQSTLKSFVATSYKQRIGHTMGASGLLETLLLLGDMRNGVIPEIPNRTESDEVFLSEPISPPTGAVLSLAAGMGNVYSAAIFKPM